MGNELSILGWKCEGLRLPDHHVSLEQARGKVYPINLIQMPNGTGKTTTLRLLRAALSGDLSKIGADVKQLRKRGGTTSKGLFEVSCLLNSRPYTYTIEFDFEQDAARIKTTRPSGQVEGFHVPPEFIKFMKSSFVDFFAFDGELAETLLDESKTNAQEALESLFHIDALKTIARRIEEFWDYQVERHTAKEEKGLNRRKNRLAELKARVGQLKEASKIVVADLEKKKKALKKLNDTYYSAITNAKTWGEKVSSAQEEFTKLDEQLKARAREVLTLIRNPVFLSCSFANWMIELKSGLDKVKLPESAAREFFEEIALESECICGRPIGHEIACAIRERAASYLGSDDVSLLNAIKSSISDATSGEVAGGASLHQEVGRIKALMREASEAKTALDALRGAAEDDNPSLKEARAKIEALNREIAVLEEKEREFHSKDDSKNDQDTNGIEIVERRIRDAELKLAEIEEVLILKAKRDVLRQIFSRIIEESISTLSTNLVKETNKKLLSIIPDNNIVLDKINRSLIIKDQGGGSVGEGLSIAYSFLGTLFGHSNHSLPLIVDSPAGAIDMKVRLKVADSIPKLTHQFVAFTISSERPNFVDQLERVATANGIRYLTLYRKSITGVRQPKKGEAYADSLDGRIVTGKAFFNDFQLESEDGG